MKRPLPNLLTAACLVTCVALVALWVRTHRVVDRLNYQSTWGRLYVALAFRGELHLAVRDRRHDVASPSAGAPGVPYTGPGFARWSVPAVVYDDSSTSWRSLWTRPSDVRGGLGFRYVAGTYGGNYRVVVVPLWAVVLGVLAPAGCVLYRRRRRHARRRAGRCASCGYDLRATPGRCPECGTGSGRAS